MGHFVILDRANGLLQWSGEAATADAAFTAFGDVLGYDSEEPGLWTRDAYDVRPVTATERAAVEQWAATGADADEFPL